MTRHLRGAVQCARRLQVRDNLCGLSRSKSPLEVRGHDLNASSNWSRNWSANSTSAWEYGFAGPTHDLDRGAGLGVRSCLAAEPFS